MPRGGSKRGERRGGRKKGQGNQPTLASLLKIVVPEKPKVKRERAPKEAQPGAAAPQPAPRGRPPGSTSMKTRERELEINMLIAGVDMDLLPREVMLKTMRYFLQQAENYAIDVARWNEVDPPTEESMRMATAAEYKLERYLILAGDQAYKCAPYMHARLAAIQHVGGSDRSPTTVLGQLLSEIDAASRGKLIEHDPGEFAEAEPNPLIPQQEDA